MSNRFTAETMSDGSVAIWDNEFGWDAALRLGGDFYGPDKLWFANHICDVLNRAKLPTREAWEAENPEIAKLIMSGERP